MSQLLQICRHHLSRLRSRYCVPAADLKRDCLHLLIGSQEAPDQGAGWVAPEEPSLGNIEHHQDFSIHAEAHGRMDLFGR